MRRSYGDALDPTAVRGEQSPTRYLDLKAPVQSATRTPFDGAMCDLVAELSPEVVSFHFGLPDKEVLAHVKDTGAKILSSATTVDEARWLEDAGCDTIIAPGL